MKYLLALLLIIAALPAQPIPQQTVFKRIADQGLIAPVYDAAGQNLATASRVASVAALRALPLTGLNSGAAVSLQGYYAAGDGGGGPVHYLSSGQAPGTYTDNAGSIIVPTGGDGSAAWRWSYSGAYNVKWFGCKVDGTTDDTVSLAALTAAARATGYGIYIPAGVMKISTWNLTAISGGTGQNIGFDIFGDGLNQSVIQIIRPVSNAGVGVDLTGSKWYHFFDLRINGGNTIADAPQVTMLQGSSNVSGNFIIGGLATFNRCLIVGYGSYTIYNLGAEELSYNDCHVYNLYTSGIPFVFTRYNTAGITSPNVTIYSPAPSMTAISFNGFQGAIIADGDYAVFFDMGNLAMASFAFNNCYFQIRKAGAICFVAANDVGGLSAINDINLENIKIEQGNATRNQQAMRLVAGTISGIRAKGVMSGGGTMTAVQFDFSTNITNSFIEWNPNDAIGGFSGTSVVHVGGTAYASIFKTNTVLAKCAVVDSGGDYIALGTDGSAIRSNAAVFTGAASFQPGTSNSTTYKLAEMVGGTASTANSKGGIYRQTTPSVANVATTIYGPLAYGELITVTGVGSGNIFADLLMAGFNGNVAVIVSNGQQGTPAARTYSVSAGNLQLTMGDATALNIVAQSLRTGGQGG